MFTLLRLLFNSTNFHIYDLYLFRYILTVEILYNRHTETFIMNWRHSESKEQTFSFSFYLSWYGGSSNDILYVHFTIVSMDLILFKSHLLLLIKKLFTIINYINNKCSNIITINSNKMRKVNSSCIVNKKDMQIPCSEGFVQSFDIKDIINNGNGGFIIVEYQQTFQTRPFISKGKGPLGVIWTIELTLSQKTF